MEKKSSDWVLVFVVIAILLLLCTSLITATVRAVDENYAHMAAANGKYCLILADVVQLDQCVTITPTAER